MTKTTDFQLLSFGHFLIWYSNLFRVSDFDLPAMPVLGFIAVTKSIHYAQIIILSMIMLHGRRVFGFCLNMTFRSGTNYSTTRLLDYSTIFTY